MADSTTESERHAPLRLLQEAGDHTCVNTFDTTSLALTNMEQANVAYGRRYVELEVDDAAFSDIGETIERNAVRVGALSDRTRLDIVRSAHVSTIARTDGFETAEARLTARRLAVASENVEAEAPAEGTRDVRLPVVGATSFGMRAVLGWIAVPPAGTDLEPPPTVAPGLYLVERYRLSSFARGFGLGDHLYSFTLFPEEEVEIEIKTWKSSEQTDKRGSSIFDGNSDAAESEFASAVQQETTRTAKREKKAEAHVEASAEASWGFGKAKVSGGGSRSSASAVEDFAKDISNATQKLTNKATRERRVEITQSSEVKVTEGEEERTKRTIRNINKCHTLNYNYFQLLRKYETRLELYDVRLRYSSGVPFYNDEESAWRYDAREVPIAQAASLLRDVVHEGAVEEIMDAIVGLLGTGGDGDPGLDVLRAGSSLALDTVPLAAQLAWEDAERAAISEGREPPPRPTARLPKTLSRDTRVLATNAVYVEAMLGKCSACEDFVRDSRVLEIEARQLENKRAAIEVERERLRLSVREQEATAWRGFRFDGLPESGDVRIFVGPSDIVDNED